MDLNNIGSFFDKIKKIILEKDILLSVISEAVKKETNIEINKKNIKINKKVASLQCSPKEKNYIYIKKAEIIKTINKEVDKELVTDLN